jgi:hypothetical protein
MMASPTTSRPISRIWPTFRHRPQHGLHVQGQGHRRETDRPRTRRALCPRRRAPRQPDAGLSSTNVWLQRRSVLSLSAESRQCSMAPRQCSSSCSNLRQAKRPHSGEDVDLAPFRRGPRHVADNREHRHCRLRSHPQENATPQLGRRCCDGSTYPSPDPDWAIEDRFLC